VLSRWQRLRMRLGRCPYCRLHYLPPSDLPGHLEWAHASRRSEWSTEEDAADG
jgi:hypothetical protein